MNIFYLKKNAAISFGALQLKKALEKKGIKFRDNDIGSFHCHINERSIIAYVKGYMENVEPCTLYKEGYRILVLDGNILVEGMDETAVMYGLFDIAETISFYGFEGICDKILNPYHELRGIKFNLPYEAFDDGDPISNNLNTCMDIEFWREFIDFLALNRYNCLSLWSEHPFHMMFRLSKYKETCPYSDRELERFKKVFKFIFSHCKKRGIKTYIITWNIRLTPAVVKGLDLPEELGFMTSEHFEKYYKEDFYKPKNMKIMHDVRQASLVIKDYLKECVKTLASSYPDLDGIGTNCAEEMNGSSYSRHEWVSEPYLEGILESGREDFDFIIRTNRGNGKIAKELFADKYKNGKTYISWKYSVAHMYSSTEPKFEELWEAWDDVDLNDVNVLYTVRNDDYHTFRNGCIDFIKEYIYKMKKFYVKGFYWGADGYIWAKDFQHFPNKHMTWKYDFEKHWFEFELIGRLAYDPNLSDDIWVEKHKEKYGSKYGETVFKAIRVAGKIIPPINRLFFEEFDFESHMESLLTSFGFKNIVDIVFSESMPGEDTLSISEFAKIVAEGKTTNSENVEEIVCILRECSDSIIRFINSISDIEDEGELKCTLLDLEAWANIASYYASKFEAAYYLCLLKETGMEKNRERAVSLLEEALIYWKKLSYIWSSHYLPYLMVRTKRYFGYTYYIDEVERDIELAKNFDFDKSIYHLNVRKIKKKEFH